MNTERRKRVTEVVAHLTEQKDALVELQSEEQEAFDNMPEGLQGSNNGQKVEESADTLQEAVDNLENIISNLEGLS